LISALAAEIMVSVMSIDHVLDVLSWVEDGVITPSKARESMQPVLPTLGIEFVPPFLQRKLMFCCEIVLDQMEARLIAPVIAKMEILALVGAAASGNEKHLDDMCQPLR
jgi:hypothetical protein